MTPAQLRALAERRDLIADYHADDAARWRGCEAYHRKAGHTETAEVFALMASAAERNEAVALNDAEQARREASRLEAFSDLRDLASDIQRKVA